MTTPDDALKAVEALAAIVREGLSRNVLAHLDADLVGRLETLEKGCRALLEGKRGTAEAQAIIARPE